MIENIEQDIFKNITIIIYSNYISFLQEGNTICVHRNEYDNLIKSIEKAKKLQVRK